MPDLASRLGDALAGRYTIERELGEGGMALVFLALDLKHNRQVALKVLKPELAAVVGAERFLAEIETTANLQHPHILPLFDSGEADGFLFYVMPYIEGETLKDRIDRERQLPVDEAVGIAVAIANALQTAHERGVIHRDIKPANILLSRGEPLVADFGIALAVGAAGGNRLTETGLSVGTPFYMSPEQATGDQPVGPASDTYSLACVLYEMLTGDPPYPGSSAQAVLGKIIQGAPPSPTEARRSIPAHVDGAILKALEKLPADRFSSAREFAGALSNPAFRYGDAATAAAGSRRGWTALTSVFAVTTVALAAVAVWALTRSPESSGVNQFVLALDEAVPSEGGVGTTGRLSFSPDGRRLVFVGSALGGGTQLWLRELDQLDARPIPDTEGAEKLSVSPDGRHVAFLVDRDGRDQIRRVPLNGGPSLPVADSLIDRGGLWWGADGYIYLDARLEGDGVARAPEAGGLPEIVTRPTTGEDWHSEPFPLPNGRGVLFFVAGTRQIAVVDLESGEHTPLVDGLWGGYARSGHLIWVTEDGRLMAQRFDQDSFELSGRAVPLAENLLVPAQYGGASVALSHEGDLAYITGEALAGGLSLVWVDRTGGVTEPDRDWIRPFRRLSLSPDGSRLAVSMIEDVGRQIWVRPTEGGGPRKLTFETENRYPSWLPDDEWVGYVSSGRQVPGIYKRRADGTGGEVLVLAVDEAAWPIWSPNEEWLVFSDQEAIIGQPLGSDGLPEGDAIVLADEGDGFDGLPAISPDGRWLAFTSIRNENPPGVYVRPFPETDRGVWLIREDAGGPAWSSDSSELAFTDFERGAMSVVSVLAGETFEHGSPDELFGMDGFIFAGWYAMDAEGERFLLTRPGGGGPEGDQRLILVQNLFELLRERVGS